MVFLAVFTFSLIIVTGTTNLKHILRGRKKISKMIGKGKTLEIDLQRRREKKKLAKEKFFLKFFFYLLKEKTRGDK